MRLNEALIETEADTPILPQRAMALCLEVGVLDLGAWCFGIESANRILKNAHHCNTGSRKHGPYAGLRPEAQLSARRETS